MTILTGVVLTVALGAVAQRSEIFSDLPTAAAHDPRDDVAHFAPGGVALIDVVANDRGTRPEDGRRLLITREPDCGAAWRHDGRIAYAAAPGCSGVQVIRYCVAQGDACREAELQVVLAADAGATPNPGHAPVIVLHGADAPASGPFAALSSAAPADGGGFRVEEPLRPAARDSAPFAAIGLQGAAAAAVTQTD